MGNYTKTMLCLKRALDAQADTIKTLSQALDELTKNPALESPEKDPAHSSDAEEVKYARASTLAKRFNFKTEQGIIPILQRGVKEGAIKKLGGPGNSKNRGAITTFLVSDVDAYMEKTRGVQKS
ncbi:hypothetical protein Amuc01_04870 [Akkermansia muciniphila]|uniref:hypothetical protein n=1 Tax=Akkermansia muciniphila TaxID=239935 RepID=UPI0024A2DEE7|nr:hypothetical protein [Akkermansia muciniphila]GLU92043.1 hypothetical protein Amuc01_04870 [Akkermansia muciniphila]